MTYKIFDIQRGCYFANGEEFNTLKKVAEQLIDFHSIDCDMKAEKKLLKEGKIKECIDELEMFEWEIQEVEK